MTASFDCPKCGAPLRFEPEPGDETVECSYCHDTVIIPEEMRIPLPEPEVELPPPDRFRQVTRRVMLVAGLVILGLCAIIVYITNQSNRSSADLSANSISFDTNSDSPEPISAVDAGTATVEAKATAQALQPLLEQEQSWPSVFIDTYDDNSHRWETGDVRDSYITGNRSVGDGIYSWNITSVKSAFNYAIPDISDQQDFFVSVDMKLVNMPDDPDADAGLIFRENVSDDSWYYFSVNQYGQYYFGRYDGTDWFTLIPETNSPLIHIDQTNHLSVGAQGSQFIFVINGQMVDHFIDDHLATGQIGVGVNLPNEDEKAIVEFSNLEVKSMSTSP